MAYKQPAIFTVIFDVDGTLVTDQLHLHKHNHVLEKILKLPELRIDEPAWQAIRGLSDPTAYAYIFQQAQQKGVDLRSFPTAEEYIRLTDKYYFDHISELRMREGAADLMAAAQHYNLPLGIGTNATRHETDAKLSLFGLNDSFRFMSCLDDVVHPKPAPDIYDHAVQLAKPFSSPTLQPRQALVIEDTRQGSIAGLEAGCRVVWWRPPHATGTLEHPNLLTTSDSREIVALIHGLATSSPAARKTIALG